MLAKINQTKGYVVVNGGKKHSGSRENLNDDFSNFEPMIEKKFFDKTKAKKSYKDFIDSNLNLTKFADCDVDFKLTFQVGLELWKQDIEGSYAYATADMHLPGHGKIGSYWRSDEHFRPDDFHSK